MRRALNSSPQSTPKESDLNDAPNSNVSSHGACKPEVIVTSTTSFITMNTNAAYDHPHMDSSDKSFTFRPPREAEKENLLKKTEVRYKTSQFLTQEYDYDYPYWSPSNMEQELIAQFRKLRIPNIPEQDLE